MNGLSSTRRKWILAAVKVLIVVLVAWFIRGAIVGAVDQLRHSAWSFSPRWLVAAAVLYLLGLLPEGLFWHRVLLALGQDARLGETLRAYFIGHLGKYVPGKAMVVVLRTGLIRSRRVDTSLAAASVFLETLTMMSVGAFLAAAILMIWFAEQRLLFWISVALVSVAGLPTLPAVFSRLARLAGVGRSNPGAAAKLAGLSHTLLLGGWIAMTIGWLLMALSLWAVLCGMGLAEADWAGQLHLYTATVALAVVGGFASSIPGGLGVREAVLAELLGRQLGVDTALLAAVLLRLVWLLAELLISAVLYLGGRYAFRRDSGLQ